VRQDLTDWPEKREQRRRWFKSKDSARRVKANGLQRAIGKIVERHP